MSLYFVCLGHLFCAYSCSEWFPRSRIPMIFYTVDGFVGPVCRDPLLSRWIVSLFLFRFFPNLVLLLSNLINSEFVVVWLTLLMGSFLGCLFGFFDSGLNLVLFVCLSEFYRLLGHEGFQWLLRLLQRFGEHSSGRVIITASWSYLILYFRWSVAGVSTAAFGHQSARWRCYSHPRRIERTHPLIVLR